jgi:DNA-binding GntR family transcriptional regulator
MMAVDNLDSSGSDGGTWVGEGVGRVGAPLRERVLEVVRQAILDFKLRPGQRLIERELIEQLGVSRTTVRDVLARLAAEGLVTMIPQKGAIVSVLTPEEAADIYQMRALLEGLAVRRFIERAGEADTAELRAIVDELNRAAEGGATPAEGLKAKDRFYRVLLRGANSPRLTEILTSLQGQVRMLRAMSLSASDRLPQAVEEIGRVVAAIEAGDSAAGAAACEEHIRNAEKVGMQRLAELSEGTQPGGAPKLDPRTLDALSSG